MNLILNLLVRLYLYMMEADVIMILYNLFVELIKLDWFLDFVKMRIS